MQPIPLRTLDLNLLKVFDAVMVERNVTRAAARLAMTQPAVSNALRRLREATRAELFVAGSTGVAPTRRARELWPAVRDALDGLQRAFEPQGFDAGVDRRRFTIAMADATAALFVPRLAEALQREQAQVDLHVVALATRDPRALLEQGQADVAIGFFPEAAAALAAEGEGAATRCDALYRCAYVGVMRRDHPLARPGALTLDAFCDALHLRVNFADRERGFVDEALSRLARRRRVMITVSAFATAGSVVQGSDPLTVLPRSFVPATGFAHRLAAYPLPFELPAIDVGLFWHRRHEQEPGQRWLRDTLTRVAAHVAAATAA